MLSPCSDLLLENRISSKTVATKRWLNNMGFKIYKEDDELVPNFNALLCKNILVEQEVLDLAQIEERSLFCGERN